MEGKTQEVQGKTTVGQFAEISPTFLISSESLITTSWEEQSLPDCAERPLCEAVTRQRHTYGASCKLTLSPQRDSGHGDEARVRTKSLCRTSSRLAVLEDSSMGHRSTQHPPQARPATAPASMLHLAYSPLRKVASAVCFGPSPENEA